MNRISQHVQNFQNVVDLEEWLHDKNPRYWTIKKIFSRPDRSFFVWYEMKPHMPENE